MIVHVESADTIVEATILMQNPPIPKLNLAVLMPTMRGGKGDGDPMPLVHGVGYFIGALTGGLISLATESGFFQGAGIGGISGAVFTIEAAESALTIWRANDSMDIICSLLSGRLVREKVGPAFRSAVQSQISAAFSPLTVDFDIFETSSSYGMSRDSVQKLPKTIITKLNKSDFSGICCVVCLQDFKIGDLARILVCCQHRFHLSCIDNWLMRQSSCPLCRQDFLNCSL
ncbi:NEP1-interacting protein 1 [Dendrobium catenatum]|uniref:NEP1-interacting protein 1 n=1 Tax=Dendrobium catenatum TaxID=906689 RepID=A0A2I0VM79_9ASPA|nr:NEP1-interacting protein 1 [Dendrobium catenatum]